MGPDLACGILVGVTKQAIRICKNRDQQEYWKSIPGQETWWACLGSPPPT